MQYKARHVPASLGLVITLLALPLQTLGAEPLLVDISPCIGIGDAARRLACFDALGTPAPIAPQPQQTQPPVTQASPQPEAAPQAVVTATDEREDAAVAEAVVEKADDPDTATATVERFGRNTPTAEARVQTNPEGERELLDEIVSLRERVPGRYLITLASGQVWYQDNSGRLRLRPGMQVRIYPSPLGGSWRMARADGEQSGFVQVTRVE